jgi:exodeoxyribonuclease VII large subunit
VADEQATPAGIPGSSLPGPFPVGGYARRIREWMRARPRLQLIGEVMNVRLARTKVFWELKDADGAVACSMWRTDWDKLGLADGALQDGAQVVVAGGPDYYPGSRNASPSFTFLATDLRIAGEGDLLAQVERLRRQLAVEGLLERQRALPRRALPRTIGVVTGESGKARDDVLAGLERRGWAGRIVWAFAPVQDRHAAPRISEALRDLAATGAVDVIIVARGGGSLADLFAFCDETLCRTVAMLPVPVIASVGHHTDRMLIDDVAAVASSTPTHAAEAAVPVHVDEARASHLQATRRLQAHGRRAVVERARALARLSRAPAHHVERQRTRLHQDLRELRAAARRRLGEEQAHGSRALLVLSRKAAAAASARERAAVETAGRAATLRRAGDGLGARRGRDLERLRLALAARDPERALERGYALVADEAGDLVTSAEAARAAGALDLRFHDGHVRARLQATQADIASEDQP